MTITIPLRTSKIPASLSVLQYKKQPLTNTQARLTGRYALTPMVQLADYQCRAVIDWICIRFFLSRNTQHQWLKSDIDTITGGNSFVEPIDKQAGDASDCFDVTFQEPNIVQIRKVIDAIEEKYDFQFNPIIQAIEISIDFYPDNPNDAQRALLYSVLTRHFCTSRNMLAAPLDRPRFIYGSEKHETVYVLGENEDADDQDYFLISTQHDRSPLTNSTYVIGARDSDCRWRIMDKVIDTQNKTAGTFKPLTDVEKRVRIEVTLGMPEVVLLDVIHLEDLQHLKFSQLQGKFFRFMLPTFFDQANIPPNTYTAIRTWQDEQRITKFSKTGILGLLAMDDALDRQKKKQRRSAQKDIQHLGLKLKPLPRTGNGSARSLVTYHELNQKVEMALRHLGKRVAASFL
ncbi:hypothetical protein G3A39_39405 [Paraburkholderia aspalathi]|nr:hypothetical protein [Paraburkholderia aspalathi]